MFVTTLLMGALAGASATLIWWVLGRFLADHSFWPRVAKLTENLVRGEDPDAFFSQYAMLLRALGIYLGKMTLRVGGTIAPVLGMLVCFGPALQQEQIRRATSLLAYPAQTLTVQTAAGPLHSRDGHFPWPAIQASADRLLVQTPHWGQSFALDSPTVITNSQWTALVASTAGYQTDYAITAPSLLLLRPHAEDQNPAWPWLSDLECSFWIALLVASLVTSLLPRLRRVQLPQPEPHSAAPQTT